MSLPDEIIDMLNKPGLISLCSRTDDLWDYLLPHLHNKLNEVGSTVIMASIEGQISSKMSFWQGSEDVVILSPESAGQALQWMEELETDNLNGEHLSFFLPVFEDPRWDSLGDFLVKLVNLGKIYQVIMLFESHNQQKARKFAPYFKFMADFSPICPIKDDHGTAKWLRTAISVKRNTFTGNTLSYVEHDIEFLGV